MANMRNPDIGQEFKALRRRIERLEMSARVPKSSVHDRSTQGDLIAAEESTLSTAGPEVQVHVGQSRRLLVLVGSRTIPGENADALMSYAITGATTIAPTDTRAWRVTFTPLQGVHAYVETGLNQGVHTVTAKYRKEGPGEGMSWLNRTLVAIPL